MNPSNLTNILKDLVFLTKICSFYVLSYPDWWLTQSALLRPKSWSHSWPLFFSHFAFTAPAALPAQSSDFFSSLWSLLTTFTSTVVIPTKRCHLGYGYIPSFFPFPKFILDTLTRVIFLRTWYRPCHSSAWNLDSDCIDPRLAKLLSLEHPWHTQTSGSCTCPFLYTFPQISKEFTLLCPSEIPLS